MVENVWNPKCMGSKLKCLKYIVLSALFDGLMQLFQRVSCYFNIHNSSSEFESAVLTILYLTIVVSIGVDRFTSQRYKR